MLRGEVMQNSFLLYADYEKYFSRLDDAEKGKLTMAIFALNRGEDLTETLSPAGQMALSFIQDQMKRDREAYEKSKNKRSEAGKRGMEARWGKKDSDEIITEDNKNNNVNNVITNNNTAITNDNKNNLNVNVNDNANVNVNENEDVNVNSSKKKNKKENTDNTVLTDSEVISYIKDNIKDEIVAKRFIDYANNRKAMGKKYAIRTKTTLDLNIMKLRKWANSVEEALEILDYSIANNYQGLFQPKKPQSSEQTKPQLQDKGQKVSSAEALVWGS